MISALVIEDNRVMSDSLCQMLSLLDVDPRPAFTPRAALLAINESIPQVIFLDINLPNVDGFEVLAYLRREPRTMNIPVIVVTAEDVPETYRKAKEGGAVSIIIKPPTFEALENGLRLAGVV